MNDIASHARSILSDLRNAHPGSYLLKIGTRYEDYRDNHNITVPFTAPEGLDARWTKLVLPYLSSSLVHNGHLELSGHFGDSYGQASWDIDGGFVYPSTHRETALAWALQNEPVGPPRWVQEPDAVSALETIDRTVAADPFDEMLMSTTGLVEGSAGVLINSIKDDLLSRYGSYAEVILRTILEGAPHGVAEINVYRSRYYVLEHENDYDASYPVYFDEQGFHLPPGAWEDLLASIAVAIDYNGDFYLRHVVAGRYVSASWYVFDLNFAPEDGSSMNDSWLESGDHVIAWGDPMIIPAVVGVHEPAE